ncbi:hypothetical protein [Carboxydothermus pertinax]|uniref:Uncharacterized protein n=1 Tax=Carboxydothermus pertinax TaxID=870242 RepID=A0A1L8CS33_9THEO|nr:hypothetical protein [Carboxydothermus pertinax]GAV21664.1 hypothetical protein cpu_01740 [Carboxydothermus pertinax]
MKFIAIFIYMLIFGVFGYPLLRDREYRELIVFSVLMVISFYYVLAVIFGWPLINPALPVIEFSRVVTILFK